MKRKTNTNVPLSPHIQATIHSPTKAITHTHAHTHTHTHTHIHTHAHTHTRALVRMLIHSGDTLFVNRTICLRMNKDMSFYDMRFCSVFVFYV